MKFVEKEKYLERHSTNCPVITRNEKGKIDFWIMGSGSIGCIINIDEDNDFFVFNTEIYYNDWEEFFETYFEDCCFTILKELKNYEFIIKEK